MTLFHLWNLPGDVLAAPESASGLDRCNISLSLSLDNHSVQWSWSCFDTARPPLAQVADPHTGAPLDDVRLVNEITILFIAGFETSGHAQAWMLCAPNLINAHSVLGY